MSDLIKKEDAIKVVHEYFIEALYKEPNKIDEDGDKVFADMKSVNKLLTHNKKISKALKELPSAEAETKCVAQIKVDTEEIVRRIKEEYDITEGGFHVARGCQKEAEDTWMKLPEPYKAESEDKE